MILHRVPPVLWPGQFSKHIFNCVPLASHHSGLHIFPAPLRFSVSIHPHTQLRVLKEEGPWCNSEGELLLSHSGIWVCTRKGSRTFISTLWYRWEIYWGSSQKIISLNWVRHSQANMWDKGWLRQKIGMIYIHRTKDLFSFARI